MCHHVPLLLLRQNAKLDTDMKQGRVLFRGRRKPGMQMK
jgi:hypothetical protein